MLNLQILRCYFQALVSKPVLKTSVVREVFYLPFMYYSTEGETKTFHRFSSPSSILTEWVCLRKSALKHTQKKLTADTKT